MTPASVMQVHLGFAGPNAYYVMWATGYNIVRPGHAPKMPLNNRETMHCSYMQCARAGNKRPLP